MSVFGSFTCLRQGSQPLYGAAFAAGVAESGDDRGFSGGQCGIDLVFIRAVYALQAEIPPWRPGAGLCDGCRLPAGKYFFKKSGYASPSLLGISGGSHAGGGSA